MRHTKFAQPSNAVATALILLSPRERLSPLQPHLAHIVQLPQRGASSAQDGQGGGGVEMEVGQGEAEDEALSGEHPLQASGVEHDVLAGESVDILGRQPPQGRAGVVDYCLEVGVVLRGRLGREAQFAGPDGLDGAQGVKGDLLQVDAQRGRVGDQPAFDDVVERNALGLEMRPRLGQEAGGGVQALQIGRHAGVVEGDGHGGISFTARCRLMPEARIEANGRAASGGSGDGPLGSQLNR